MLVWRGGGHRGYRWATGVIQYLERSDSIERRNANKFSAPLDRGAAPGKKRAEG